ncbi:MAG: TraM recognition domain-containing protein [Flavipsychrobacter sp.]|nr:TraM recognition domain-containing protein [Flavipsychrobacter sp.]
MPTWDLDTQLLRFVGESPASSFTLRNSFEGVQVFGGIGSGKSTGSGRMLAIKYLQHGFGGLVLTVKPDEKDIWMEYAEIAGRQNDVIVIEPGQKKYVFNFLEYESKKDYGTTYTDNIHQVLRTVIRASEEKNEGRSDDAFWQDSLDLFLNNVITLCLLAYNKVTVQLLFDIAQSVPKKIEQANKENSDNTNNGQDKEPELTEYQKAVRIVKNRISLAIKDWNRQQPEGYVHSLTEIQYEEQLDEAIPGYRELKMLDSFFMGSFFSIGDKTRAIIEFCLTSFLQKLLRDPIYSLFARYPSTVTPEHCLQGKIIILNLPVKIYHHAGQYAQMLFKYIWQRAMEQRNIAQNNRPVFMVSDEAQHFTLESDAVFQATARSSRVATVYLTQNMANYFANMGGQKSEYRVKSFLGTLATKIFHANADVETNSYASELIGEAYTDDHSKNITIGGNVSVSKGSSLKLEAIVRKEEFSRLKTGGPLNDYVCEAYIVMQGKVFSNGMNFHKAAFHQLIIPKERTINS